MLNFISRFCNVRCAIIQGKRKTFVENTASGPQWCKASWCAVLVKGTWRFVDPSFPGLIPFIQFEPSERSTFPKEKDKPSTAKGVRPPIERVNYIRFMTMDFYYQPDQAAFISSHFPEDEYWQLLCRPVKETEWEQNVAVTPFFFQFELSVQMKPSRLIKCNGGPLFITFRYPLERHLLFVADILNDKKLPVSKDAAQIYVEADIRLKSVTLQFYALKKGQYSVHIFCRDLNSEYDGYVLVCSHDIDVTKQNATPKDAIQQPPPLRQIWGPADDTLISGLSPVSHKQSTIECETDVLFVEFKAEKSDMDYQVSLMDKKGINLNRRVLHWKENEKFIVRINAPGNVHCIMCIYCVPLGTPNFPQDEKSPICSYMMQFHTQSKKEQLLANIPEEMSQLGVTENGLPFGLVPLFSPFSVMTLHDETQLEFKNARCRIT